MGGLEKTGKGNEQKVYFIRANQSGLIKIGTTIDVAKRFASLRQASPEPLTLLKAISASRHAEKYLHAKFKNIRIRGEWFLGSEELLQFICNVSDMPGFNERSAPKNKTIAAFLRGIMSFLQTSGMSAREFGQRAVGDSGYIYRLQGGAGTTIAKIEQVQAYIKANRRRSVERVDG